MLANYLFVRNTTTPKGIHQKETLSIIDDCTIVIDTKKLSKLGLYYNIKSKGIINLSVDYNEGARIIRVKFTYTTPKKLSKSLFSFVSERIFGNRQIGMFNIAVPEHCTITDQKGGFSIEETKIVENITIYLQKRKPGWSQPFYIDTSTSIPDLPSNCVENFYQTNAQIGQWTWIERNYCIGRLVITKESLEEQVEFTNAKYSHNELLLDNLQVILVIFQVIGRPLDQIEFRNFPLYSTYAPEGCIVSEKSQIYFTPLTKSKFVNNIKHSTLTVEQQLLTRKKSAKVNRTNRLRESVLQFYKTKELNLEHGEEKRKLTIGKLSLVNEKPETKLGIYDDNIVCILLLENKYQWISLRKI